MSVHHAVNRNLWFAKWREGGKERRKYFGCEEEARAFEDERKAAANDEPQGKEPLTVGELALVYIRNKPDLHPETKRKIVYFLAGYENAQAMHVPGAGEFLRDKYVERLTRQDLERMREICRAHGTGNATINKYQAYLRAIFSWGVEQDLVSINPWRDYKRLKVLRPIYNVTVQDMQRVYAELPSYLKWALKTAFFLALRPGKVELFSLQWSAFNFRRGVALVRQGKTGRLKTVLLHPAYMAEAMEHYKEDKAAGVVWVVHNGGRRIRSMYNAWHRACHRAGVTMRPYDIRHIAASEMLSHGADLSAVAAQLGHSSAATTGAIYAHVVPGAQARAALMMPVLDDGDTEVIQNLPLPDPLNHT